MAHCIAPVRDCQFLPLEGTAHIWLDAHADPRVLLTAWATTYADEYAKHHPTTLAWSAVRLVGQRFAEHLGTVEIARELGASTSTLVRRFADCFGLTLVEYRARTRLVRAFTELRQRDVKVEDMARRVGFASVTNFNLASRKHARLTPSVVRRLPQDEFQRLLAHELQIDAVGTCVGESERRETSRERSGGRDGRGIGAASGRHTGIGRSRRRPQATTIGRGRRRDTPPS